MSPIRIRSAGQADIDILALIGAATFLETFAGLLDGRAIVAHCREAHSARAYRDCLGGPDAAAWLATIEPGEAPIGFALLAAPDLPGADPERDAELKRIYVLSRYHGGGTGRALMSAAIDRAVAMSRKRLLLGVYAGNARARSFYAACGFQPVGERVFRVGGRDYDDIIHALTLA